MANENLLRGQIKGTLEKEQNRLKAAERGGGRVADTRFRNKILDSGKARRDLQGGLESWKEISTTAALLGVLGLGTPKGTPKQASAFTESHRITESFRLEKTLGIIESALLYKVLPYTISPNISSK